MQRSRKTSNAKKESVKNPSKEIKLLRLPTNETHGSKFTAEYFDMSDSYILKSLSNPRYKQISTSQSQQFSKYYNSASNGFSPNIGPLTTQSSFRHTQNIYRGTGGKKQFQLTSRNQDSIIQDNNSFLSQPVEKKTFYDHKHIYTLKDYKNLPNYDKSYFSEKDETYKERKQLLSQFRGKITKHMINKKLKQSKNESYKKIFQDQKQTTQNMDSFLLNDLEQSFFNQNINLATKIDKNRFNYLKMNNEQASNLQKFQVNIIFKGDNSSQVIQRKYQHQDLQEFVIRKFEPFLNSSKVNYGEKIERISSEYTKLIKKLQGNIYKINLPDTYKPRNQNYNDYYKFNKDQLKMQLRNIEFLKRLDVDIFDLITQDDQLYKYKKLGELNLEEDQSNEEDNQLIIQEIPETESPTLRSEKSNTITDITISEERPRTPTPENDNLPIQNNQNLDSDDEFKKGKKSKYRLSKFILKEKDHNAKEEVTEENPTKSIIILEEEEKPEPKPQEVQQEIPENKDEDLPKSYDDHDDKKVDIFLIKQKFVDKKQEDKDVSLSQAVRPRQLSRKSTQKISNQKITVQNKKQNEDIEQEKEDSYSMSESEFASNKKKKYIKNDQNNNNQNDDNKEGDMVVEITAKVSKITVVSPSPLKRADENKKTQEQEKTQQNIKKEQVEVKTQDTNKLQPPTAKIQTKKKKSKKTKKGIQYLGSQFLDDLLSCDNVYKLDIDNYRREYKGYEGVPSNIEFPKEEDKKVYDTLLRWQYEVNDDLQLIKKQEFKEESESQEEQIITQTSLDDSDDYNDISVHTEDMQLDDDIREGRDQEEF